MGDAIHWRWWARELAQQEVREVLGDTNAEVLMIAEPAKTGESLSLAYVFATTGTQYPRIVVVLFSALEVHISTYLLTHDRNMSLMEATTQKEA